MSGSLVVCCGTISRKRKDIDDDDDDSNIIKNATTARIILMLGSLVLLGLHLNIYRSSCVTDRVIRDPTFCLEFCMPRRSNWGNTIVCWSYSSYVVKLTHFSAVNFVKDYKSLYLQKGTDYKWIRVAGNWNKATIDNKLMFLQAQKDFCVVFVIESR